MGHRGNGRSLGPGANDCGPDYGSLQESIDALPPESRPAIEAYAREAYARANERRDRATHERLSLRWQRIAGVAAILAAALGLLDLVITLSASS